MIGYLKRKLVTFPRYWGKPTLPKWNDDFRPLVVTSYGTILVKILNIIIISSTRGSVDQQLIEMSGRDPFNSLPSCFCCDYEIVLNQNLVQDVQGFIIPQATLIEY